MTFHNKENQKIFYKIGEVAKELNVKDNLSFS